MILINHNKIILILNSVINNIYLFLGCHIKICIHIFLLTWMKKKY